MTKKKRDPDNVPEVSPLRKRSREAPTPTNANSPPIQDNEAERLARRRQESSSLPADGRRESFGVSYISQLSTDQLQKKLLDCVKLNIDNKISMKNAFAVPAIDLLTYFAKNNSNPDRDPELQIAGSTLVVGAKVYYI